MRIEYRFEGQTFWLTQKLMAELFQIGLNTVNRHLRKIYADNELEPEATIRSYRIVQTEGARQIARDIEHNSMPVLSIMGNRSSHDVLLGARSQGGYASSSNFWSWRLLRNSD